MMIKANFSATTVGRNNDRPSAVQEIYTALRKRILTLALKPGEKLTKNAITAEFNVSPTPIRAAFMLLEEEGLVDIYPQSGTRVSYINVQSAREAHFLRMSVEIEIARRLCTTATALNIIDLRTLIQKQKLFLQESDLLAFVDMDNAFHRRMYEMAGVMGLWHIVQVRCADVNRLRQLHVPIKGKAEMIVKDHIAIVDAIEANNPDAAEDAIRWHLKDTVSADNDIRKFPEYFLGNRLVVGI